MGQVLWARWRSIAAVPACEHLTVARALCPVGPLGKAPAMPLMVAVPLSLCRDVLGVPPGACVFRAIKPEASE